MGDWCAGPPFVDSEGRGEVGLGHLSLKESTGLNPQNQDSYLHNM